METMFTRASESIDFGLKSPEKPCKLSKKLPIDLSGPRGRVFESPHSDQMQYRNRKFSVLIFLFEPRGSVWGRLRALPVADEASKKEWQ